MNEFEQQEEHKDIYDLIVEFPWADRLDINRDEKRITVLGTDDVLFSVERGIQRLRFFLFNQDDNTIVRRACVESLYFSDDIDVQDLVNFWNNDTSSGYTLSFNYPIFRRILLLSENGINKIKVSNGYQKIQTRRRTNEVLLPVDKFIEIKDTADDISKQGTSRKNSIERYLVNKSIDKFLNKKIKDVTTVDKGDYTFIVERSNLKIKNTKSDFKSFLNDTDIQSIENLADLMVRKEVFSNSFLRKLDEYFIKEKLSDIISIGREISILKSEDVKTDVAKRVYGKFTTKDKIKQMESIWQVFFEKYLLYLIFSYKKIVPKVQLEVEGIKKKYPDFVGVNHYNGVDIIEIKTHLKEALVWDDSHENFAFSPELSKAMVQTLNYMDAVSRRRFKKEVDKESILENLTEEENLYHPRGIIIISSSNRLVKKMSKLSSGQREKLRRDFTKLRNSIQNIQILTFDEVLGIAEKYTENIVSSYEN